MDEKVHTVTQKPWWKRWEVWLVVGLVLLLHIVIFRGVLAAAPEISQNEASVVRDELVPFFSFEKGFIPEATSQLTGSDEFRVTYSFWTSWLRYNPILPYALVLLSTLSALLVIFAFYRIVRHFTANHPRRALYVSLLAGLLIHFVLLYAKVAHFYTLVFGFGMFALSLSLAIEQLFLQKKLKKRNILIVSLLVLLNPAIHYHLIFYLSLGLLFVIQALMTVINKEKFLAFVKRSLAYILPVFLLSLLPYLLYIRLTTPAADDVFAQVPVDYWAIFYSSLPLSHLFSLDSLGHVDLYRYGEYLAPQARILTGVVFVMIASLFFFRNWYRQKQQQKTLILTLFALMLIAVWMSLGYSNQQMLSFHGLLGGVSLFLAEQSNFIASEIGKLIGIFINVLRYPHRFEFILFYAVGVLFAIGLLWIMAALQRKGWRRITIIGLVATLAVAPFMLQPAYRNTYASGDFDGFLKPYNIPADLSHIKGELEKSDNNHVFILPSLEGGREIVTPEASYSFLDKYLIYYLEQPTLYYGWGAETQQKLVAYMVYRAIAYDESWWEDILINNFGITHIVSPKNVAARSDGVMYLPDIEHKIEQSLQKTKRFTPVHEGDDYSLYAATEKRSGPATMVDAAWPKLLKEMNERNFTESSLYFPVQLKDFRAEEAEQHFYSDNPERSFYRLFTTPDDMFRPSGHLLPFDQDLIASSNYSTNMLSLSTLYDRDNRYNHMNEIVPSLLNLQTAQFVGINPAGEGKITVDIKVAEEGEHRVLLHAASKAQSLSVTVGDQEYDFERLESDPVTGDHLDFTYYAADIDLSPGTHTMVIQNTPASVLLEYVTALPLHNIPDDFTHYRYKDAHITPTNRPDTYKIETTRGDE